MTRAMDRRPIIAGGCQVPVTGVVGRRGERRCRQLRVLASDGASLAVRDEGPLDAEHVVVFVHGLCLSDLEWELQVKYLQEQYGGGIRLIRYDQRGHGNSSQAPMSSYRVPQLGLDLAAVLRALRVSGRVTLVTHSMGGMAALEYFGLAAADRPLEPHGLVLIATAAGQLAERGLGRLLAAPVTAALVDVVNHTPQAAWRLLAGPLGAAVGHLRAHSAQRKALVALTAGALLSTPVATAVGFLPSLKVFDRAAVLGSIRARTVVVSGEADLLTPPVHSVQMAAAIPGAVHLQLPGVGHMIPQEAPQVINAAISRVIEATPGLLNASWGSGDGASAS